MPADEYLPDTPVFHSTRPLNTVELHGVDYIATRSKSNGGQQSKSSVVSAEDVSSKFQRSKRLPHPGSSFNQDLQRTAILDKASTLSRNASRKTSFTRPSTSQAPLRKSGSLKEAREGRPSNHSSFSKGFDGQSKQLRPSSVHKERSFSGSDRSEKSSSSLYADRNPPISEKSGSISSTDKTIPVQVSVRLSTSGHTQQLQPTYQVPSNCLAMSARVPEKMQRKCWRIDDYTILTRLYTGYASNVFKAFCKLSMTMVALKVYDFDKLHELCKHQILREIRIHSCLDHDNIVRLYAAFQQGSQVVLVQEYADAGDLFCMLPQLGGRMSERAAVEAVIYPLLSVVNYLHSRGIVHRDIKLENILFSGKLDMVLKLGDFGIALNVREERAVTRAGTLDYMAPEILKCPNKQRADENKDKDDLAYTAAVDIWALGVLAFELLNGCPPFTSFSKPDTESRISHSMPAFGEDTSDLARNFILSALQKNSIARPTAWQLLHHPWISAQGVRRSAGNLTSCVVRARGSALYNAWEAGDDGGYSPFEEEHMLPQVSSIDGYALDSPGTPSSFLHDSAGSHSYFSPSGLSGSTSTPVVGSTWSSVDLRAALSEDVPTIIEAEHPGAKSSPLPSIRLQSGCKSGRTSTLPALRMGPHPPAVAAGWKA